MNAANAAALPVMLATRALPEMEAEQADLLARHRAAAGTAPLGAQYEAIGVRAPPHARRGLGDAAAVFLIEWGGGGRWRMCGCARVGRATCMRGVRPRALGGADSGRGRCEGLP